jgi:hypothetical protein
MCAVSGCIVVLKDHIFWQISCMGCWRSIWYVTDSTMMGKRKWPFKKGCKFKKQISINRIFKLVPSWNKCISVLSLWTFMLFEKLVVQTAFRLVLFEEWNHAIMPVTMDSGNSILLLDGCTCKDSGLKMWFSWCSIKHLVVSQFLTDSMMYIYDGQLQHSGYISVNWWFPKLVPALVLLRHLDMLNQPLQFIIMPHLFVILQCFMTCCIVMQSTYTSINGQWILMGEMFAQNKLSHTMNLAGPSFPLLLLHMNLFHE